MQMRTSEPTKTSAKSKVPETLQYGGAQYFKYLDRTPLITASWLSTVTGLQAHMLCEFKILAMCCRGHRHDHGSAFVSGTERGSD